MKKLSILFVLVLTLGVLAFGAQGAVFAEGGTVNNPSVQDDSSCSDGDLNVAGAVAYVNGITQSDCRSFLTTASSSPDAPAGLKSAAKPVQVFFNQDVTPLVEVCFPMGPGGMGQIYKAAGDPASWYLVTTYENENGMACGISWGGGVFGYFK